MRVNKDYPAGKDKRRTKTKLIIEPQEQQNFFSNTEQSKYKVLHPKNEKQKQYLESLYSNTITIAIGCPGTAKTLLALYYGFLLIQSKQIDKIYYIKPNVGSKWERDIGATPGELKDKLNDALLDPVKDNLPVFMSAGEIEYHLNKGTIEAKLFANIRGATFRNCMCILDEAQNVPPEAVKTFLTRLGQNCKMVIMGDPNQTDIDLKCSRNGLMDVAMRLDKLVGVGLVKFGKEDIVRHGLIKQILERYETCTETSI
jgi:phosphate starvation-inducible PhoH-like protein